MKRNLLNYFVIQLMVIILLSLQGCSYAETKEATRRVEYTQIVEKKSAIDAMNELYVAADGDIESLARILQTTPSVINRIRQGETLPTMDFEEKYKEILVYYNLNDRSFSKLQSALDDEYSWYNSVLNFPSHHPWWFWSINIVLILILAFAALIAIWPILLELLIFLIAWIFLLIYSPSPMEDRYTDSINPIMEQIS
jgi:hypothetical protein